MIDWGRRMTVTRLSRCPFHRDWHPGTRHLPALDDAVYDTAIAELNEAVFGHARLVLRNVNIYHLAEF
jgi:hypothetical protein